MDRVLAASAASPGTLNSELGSAVTIKGPLRAPEAGWRALAVILFVAMAAPPWFVFVEGNFGSDAAAACFWLLGATSVYSLAASANRAVVTMGDGLVRVRFGPLPWFHARPPVMRLHEVLRFSTKRTFHKEYDDTGGVTHHQRLLVFAQLPLGQKEDVCRNLPLEKGAAFAAELNLQLRTLREGEKAVAKNTEADPSYLPLRGDNDASGVDEALMEAAGWTLTQPRSMRNP
jgi:hypothetical protein